MRAVSPTSQNGYGIGQVASNGVTPLASPPIIVDGVAEDRGIPWSRYVDAVKRYALLIVAVVTAGSFIGSSVASRVKPTYEATSIVWVNSPPNGAQQSGPIRQPQLVSAVSWLGLVQSFAVVDAVVSELRLNIVAEQFDSAAIKNLQWTPATRSGAYQLKVDKVGRAYTLSTANGKIVERGSVGDSIGRKVGLQWQPDSAELKPGRFIAFQIRSPRDISVSLIRGVKATLPDDGQFMKISVNSTSPRHAARVVNAWAAQLVKSSGALKKNHLFEFKRILGEQLALAENELRASENDLERFRVNTITLPSTPSGAAAVTQADPSITNYFQERAELDELQSERATLERMVADARGGAINPQGFLQVPSILNNAPQLRSALDELSLRKATLRTEQQFLTDANPRIKQIQEAIRVLETETIPQITRDVVSSLRAREPELGARIAVGSQTLRAIPPRTTTEMRLARKVAAGENLYNSLKARFEEVSIAEAQTTPDLAVLDTAVAPNLPTSNDGPRVFLIAVVASIGLALAIALILDRLDPLFRYPEQATHELGLSIAATVPKFRPTRRGDFQLTALSQAVESFRTLRLALRYDFPDGVPVVLGVSSPAAGDGKSLIAANLGLAFASAGSKTLLIDGDVRRGALHSIFDAPVTPGLVDYLQGRLPIESIVRATSSENLYLLPRGTRRDRAPELLVSDLMTGLIRAMREKFDVVIIDSPPLVAGIDAYALGAAAGSMLIVLRPSFTDRKLAAAKLQVLDRLPVRILGAVLNAVPGGGAYRYYGADYPYGNGSGSEPFLDLATPKGLVLRS